MSKKDWFASWFDTSYYHTLYRSRDQKEAKKFITRLVQVLKLEKDSCVLDLACGKGRHSRTLEELGMQVLGVDLSNQSIKSAKKHESENLRFLVHDMRDVIEGQTFDAIFNLFTSFGYFDDEAENDKVLQGVNTMLRPSGLFVFDYLNLEHTVSTLVEHELREIDGIHFEIKRKFDGKYIRKEISVEDQGHRLEFEEKVRGFHFAEMKNKMLNVHLKPIAVFGDFELNEYDEHTSERMIIICKKAL